MLTFFLAALESDDDRRMFEAIYARYHARMEQTALRILTDQKDAEDALQNAFVQVIRHFEKIYSIPCKELPFWLVSIVKNESISILRKRKRQVPLEDWAPFPQQGADPLGYLDLVDLVRSLPESYRAVLEMKLLLGYTDRETAQRLGITERAVSARASRGRALLRDMIEKEGMPE